MNIIIEETIVNPILKIDENNFNVEILIEESIINSTILISETMVPAEAGTNYTDVELVVEIDEQIEFNIFSEPTKSNLYINDCIFFKDKSYLIQNVSGNWRLIWLNEFLLKTTDLLIFRKS